MFRRMAIAAGLCAAVLLSCPTSGWALFGKTVPTGRTLPEHIKRVYVPEFRNQSREYGFQAGLTLAVQEEFMADGRLDLHENANADVRLEGLIKSFRTSTNGSSGDRIPLLTQYDIIVVVELWDPYDTDRVAPIGRYTVPATVTFMSDTRRSLMETETEAKERLAKQAAKNIVQKVLTGAPDPVQPATEKAIKRYQDRNNPQKFEPVLTNPRFPKPTPYGAKPAQP